ncbi:MAG: TonB-dependent receptor, partial [Flavobacteriaceae bacterium]|nr:TonB-dependent receptor [Flavobacteriaceae bacterium]
YSKSIDNIRSLTNFESVIRTNSFFNSGFADETFSARGRFQRTFKKIRASIDGNFNYSKFNQFVQGQRTLNESYNQTYRAELRTNFRDAPNIEIGYSYRIQDVDQGSNRNKFFTNTPSIEFDAYIWKKFTFRTDYSYNNFSNEEGTLNEFQFWNASLSYRKDQDAKFEYILNATNILDTKSQNQSSNSAISVAAQEYIIQPRYVTFRLRYEL